MLERREQGNDTTIIPVGGVGGSVIMMPPPVDEDYWTYRVRLTKSQAVVGFPKYSTIGVGFTKERETGYDVNLPYSCPTADIVKHIKSNKGNSRIDDADVFEAVRMIQWAALTDRMAERRELLRQAREVDWRLPFPSKLADELGDAVNMSLRELDMLIAEAQGLREENRLLTRSEDGRAVLLESELDRATAELKVLRGGMLRLELLRRAVQRVADALQGAPGGEAILADLRGALAASAAPCPSCTAGDCDEFTHLGWPVAPTEGHSDPGTPCLNPHCLKGDTDV